MTLEKAVTDMCFLINGQRKLEILRNTWENPENEQTLVVNTPIIIFKVSGVEESYFVQYTRSC